MPLTHDIGVRIPYPLPENGDSAAAELPFVFSLLSVHFVADASLRGLGALRAPISFGVHSPVSLTAGASVPLCAIGSLAVFGWCDAVPMRMMRRGVGSQKMPFGGENRPAR